MSVCDGQLKELSQGDSIYIASKLFTISSMLLQIKFIVVVYDH